MLKNCLFVLLGATLVMFGNLFSTNNQLTAQHGTGDVVFDRVYAKDIVFIENAGDMLNEFEGTMITPRKIIIKNPTMGEINISYDSIRLTHPETGQEIILSFTEGVVTRGITKGARK